MVGKPAYWNEFIAKLRKDGVVQSDDVVYSPRAQSTARLFDDIIRKADVSDPLRGPRDEDDSKKLSNKLRAMVDAMLVAVPSLDRQAAQHFLLHHPRGRSLALHLNEISKKKDTPMLDIRKLLPVIEILEEGLQNRAKLEKRDGETDAKAIARKYENDLEYRKSWARITEMKRFVALSKGMASLEPTMVGGKDATDVNDATKAVRLLNEMAEKNGRSFETEFSDPANKELAAATYSRPTASSTSGSELQR